MIASIRMYDQKYTNKVETGERWVGWIVNSIWCNGTRINNPDYGYGFNADGASGKKGIKPLNINKI